MAPATSQAASVGLYCTIGWLAVWPSKRKMLRLPYKLCHSHVNIYEINKISESKPNRYKIIRNRKEEEKKNEN